MKKASKRIWFGPKRKKLSERKRKLIKQSQKLNLCYLPALGHREAVFLKDHYPIGNTILNEIDDQNNATLVNSFCGKFDGVAYARDNSKNLTYAANRLYFKIILKGTNKDNELALFSQTQTTSDRSYFVTTNTNGYLKIYLSQNGNAWDGFIYTLVDVMDGVWHTIEFLWEDGVVKQFDMDGNPVNYYGTYTGTIHIANAYFEISRAFNSYMWKGNIAYLKVGEQEYNFAEGGLSDTLYNTGTAGDNAILSGATLSDFWSERQNINHYNFLSGFDLYENGNDSEEIRVPIGKTVTQSGYTYSGTYIAGKWHNGAETGILLPSNLTAVINSDCLNPLYYSDFESNFNDSDLAFSNTEEKKHKYLVFYDTALDTAGVIRVQKCLKQKNGEDILTDESGLPLTDEDGVYLTTENEEVVK